MVGAVVSMIISEPVAILVTGKAAFKSFNAGSRTVVPTTTLVAVKSALVSPARTVYTPVVVVPVKALIKHEPPEFKLIVTVPTIVTGSLKLILILILSPALYEPFGVDEVIAVMVGAVVSITISEPVAILVTGNAGFKSFKAASRTVVPTTTLVADKSALVSPARTVYTPVVVVPEKAPIKQVPPEFRLMVTVPMIVTGSLKLILTDIAEPAL